MINLDVLNDIIKDFPNKDKIAIAGGAILDLMKNTTPKDYDIFFQDIEAQESLISFLDKNAELVSKTDKLVNYIYLGYPLELVLNRFYDLRTSELIDSFDFTVCQAQFVNGHLLFGKTFYKDLVKTELVINKISFAAHSLKRAEKYKQKGYTLSNSDYEKLKNQPESNFYSRIVGLVNPTEQEVKEIFLDAEF